MQIALVISSVLALVVAYTDLDDTFDYDSVLKNPDQLKMLLNCLFDKGPCTDVFEHYKRHTLEAVTDGCNECNNIERHKLRTFLDGLKVIDPEGYEQFKKKYDKDGTHFQSLLAKIKKF